MVLGRWRVNDIAEGGEGADFLLREFACDSIGADMVGTYVDTITDMERRGNHAVLVGVARHGFLGFSHAASKELVVLVEVDCQMSCS